MEEERLKAILESLLFAAAEPVALSQLVTVLETVARDDIKKALAEMAVAYAGGGRGIVLEEVAGGDLGESRRIASLDAQLQRAAGDHRAG